ncbi:MAG: hypothetical protein Q8911_11725 [Bacillota bacterium]|nr:hypothetical protein [Bacillota bacterium]
MIDLLIIRLFANSNAADVSMFSIAERRRFNDEFKKLPPPSTSRGSF